MNRPKRVQKLKVTRQTVRIMDADKLLLVTGGNEDQKTGCSNTGDNNITYRGPCDHQ